MPTLQEAMQEYKKQLEDGSIQVAYQGLMDYMLKLRSYFEKKYPNDFVSGSLYAGYMDMTYFSYIPESFKPRKLKIAIVFLHREFRFEVWLAAVNKQVQERYWKQIKVSGWNRYSLVAGVEGADAIVEHVIVENPDFSDLNALTERIERETLAFRCEVEAFLG